MPQISLRYLVLFKITYIWTWKYFFLSEHIIKLEILVYIHYQKMHHLDMPIMKGTQYNAISDTDQS